MLVTLKNLTDKSNTPMPKKNKVKGAPTQSDIDIGKRVRKMRNLRGVSQEELAQHVGVTYQQLQKYEQGYNRISCGRLKAISAALKIEPEYFFRMHPSEKIFANENDPYFEMDKETIELILLFRKVKSADLRKAVLSILKQQVAVI